MVRILRIGRNGNALAVTVPRSLRDELLWNRGDMVAAAVEDGRMVLRKIEEHELVVRPRSIPKRTSRKQARH